MSMLAMPLVCSWSDSTAGEPLNNSPTLKKLPLPSALLAENTTPEYVTDPSVPRLMKVCGEGSGTVTVVTPVTAALQDAKSEYVTSASAGLAAETRPMRIPQRLNGMNRFAFVLN